jgi:ABC-type Na+ transport system ATPase subunit NatA
VRVLEHDLWREAHHIRRHLGVVFQHPSLDPKLTVAENQMQFFFERQDLEEDWDRLLAEVEVYMDQGGNVLETIRTQVREALHIRGGEIRCRSNDRSSYRRIDSAPRSSRERG